MREIFMEKVFFHLPFSSCHVFVQTKIEIITGGTKKKILLSNLHTQPETPTHGPMTLRSRVACLLTEPARDP